MSNGFGPGGQQLWDDITEAHDLDPQQRVQLVEVCRAKDRLDKLDAILRGDAESWLSLWLDESSGEMVVRVDAALDKANTTANLMKQLLASLRLPDESGKRPQQRGGARGSYKPKTTGTTAAAKASARWGS